MLFFCNDMTCDILFYIFSKICLLHKNQIHISKGFRRTRGHFMTENFRPFLTPPPLTESKMVSIFGRASLDLSNMGKC